MAPLQTNARLREVRRGSGATTSGGYRDDPAPGPAAFQGDVGVYYEERRRRVTTDQGSDVLVERFLHVDTREPALEWAQGDTVSFETRRGTVTGTVQTIEASELDEMAGTGVETTTLELEPA